MISPSIRVQSGGLEVWCSGSKILMRRIRFVHFFIDLSTLVYFSGVDAHAGLGRKDLGAIAVSFL